MMEYLSIKQTSEKWGITVRRIQVLCAEGVYPVPQRLDHIGLFRQMQKNQMIKGLRVGNI